MKVPISWLKCFLDFNLTPKALSDVLTAGGLEVEAMASSAMPFTDVVVCQVLTAEKHPDADRLKVATVFDGKETLQIVCGAPNCRAGMYTALAHVGAELPLPEGTTFKIKKSKIRGQESSGMLCSATELGLKQADDGILELPEQFKEGTPLQEIFGDVVLDVSLTPNLGHCMSILGIARELSTLLNIPLKESTCIPQETGPKTSSLISIHLLDKKQAPIFACRILQGIEVKESPAWLKERLEACGVRSLNAVVDVSNFVMLEMGQPLHVFDYQEIDGKKLTITSQTKHLNVVTLDDVKRDIPPQAVLVCDEIGPLSFAGIMGGKRGSIASTTKDIVIEAAFFTPQAIRASSKILCLKTDASQRFEKGIDPNGLEAALNRAALLIQEICGGTITQGIVSEKAHVFEKKKITCRVERVNALLGTQLSLRDIATLFGRSQLEVIEEGTHALTVLVPTFRGDLLREIDLIEEIARVYGYNHIPKSKSHHTSSSLSHAPLFLIEKEIKNRLIGCGLQEVITCDLMSPELAALSLGNTLSSESLISVLAPSSLEQSVLRASLLPGLLEVVKYNSNQGFQNIASFEVGRIHFREKEHCLEYSSLGIILTGNRENYHFDPKPRETDFFDLKGILENLFEALHLEKASYQPSHFNALHPGKQARILLGDEPIGIIGQVHPRLTQNLKITTPLYFAELGIDTLLSLLPKEKRTHRIIPYPGSERDWTLTLSDHTPIGDLFKAIKAHKSALLENVYLLDLYKSSQIGKDRKNVTVRFFYRDPHQTIGQATVDQEHMRVTQIVAELFQLPS